MEPEQIVAVERRFEAANRFVDSMYAGIVILRKAFYQPVTGSGAESKNPSSNGNGNGNGDWSWDLPQKGEQPVFLRKIEAILKYEIPMYHMFMYHCAWCGMVFVNYRDEAHKSAEILLNLPEDKKILYGYVQDGINSIISPPLGANNFDENGIEITSGICKFCTDCSIVGENERREQREEGFPDCFGKSLVFCNRFNCSRREIRPGEGLKAPKPGCLPKPEEVKEYPLWLYRQIKLQEFGHFFPYTIIRRG